MSLNKKIRYINEKLSEVTKIFGTESVEYERLKLRYERAFMTRGKVNGNIVITGSDPDLITREYDGHISINIESLTEQMMSEESTSYYEGVIDKIYARFKDMGTVLQMANKYKDVVGYMRSYNDMLSNIDNLREEAYSNYLYEKKNDEVFYISSEESVSGEIEGVISELNDSNTRNKVIELLKARKGTTGVRAEILFERAKNLALNKIIEEKKEEDKRISEEDDEIEPLTIDSAMPTIRATRRRKK